MPATLESGKNVAYCVGEPWNQQAVAKGIGVPVVTNYDIWKNNPEKVFGVTKAWADENPLTLIAVTKALIKAGKWLDETDASGKLVNRDEACRILSQKNYVGADSSNTTAHTLTTQMVSGSLHRCAAGDRSQKLRQLTGITRQLRAFTFLRYTARQLTCS